MNEELVADRIVVVNEKLEGFKGHAKLVRDMETGQHYVVSGVDAMFSGWEVLVFESDPNGTVTSWADIAGGRGLTHAEAIADLAATLGAKP